EQLFRRELAVADEREDLFGLAGAEFRERLERSGGFDERLDVDVVAPCLFLEHLPPEFDRLDPLLAANQVLDFVPRVRRVDEVQPVAARLVAGGRHDLDDVAVAEVGAERHHLAVDARADALMSDVGVHGVREVDRRRAARERLHLPLGRERVDLLGVELDLQVLDELLRIAHFLLVLDQLPHPLEVPLVALIADAAFLVLPVRRDALFGPAVHLDGADLDFERRAAVADDRGVQRLVAVGPRHRDEVLDAAGHRLPGLMNDAERRVAVLDRVGDQPERDEVVDLIELDLLPLEFLVDAPQALDAAVHLHHRNLRVAQLRLDGAFQLLNQALGRAALEIDLDAERVVRLRLEILERQFLELVFDLAHPEAVGDGRVDIARLLRDALTPVLGQVVQRAHVVHAIRELHENHADVVHHGEQHLAEVLRLPLLGGRERDGADLGDPFDHVRDVGAEELLDALDRGEGVFDDVV